MPRILVAEDSSTQAEELRLILEAEGFEVEVAQDGQAALGKLRAAPYDLILSDILMPGLSGYDLCRQAKTDPSTKHIPVILLTQLTDPLDILHGLECGAENFITKPFDANNLLQRLRNVLANRARRAAGAAEGGAVLSFRGRGITVTADMGQILDLLLAAVEESVRSRQRERQAQVDRDALERQAADLTEAARQRDRHLAMLAHELRGPLAPLRTSLQVLRQPEATAEARGQSLDRMERQLRHLGRLLDDLLDASRLQQGNVRLRIERLDLARLLRTAAEDRRTVLDQAGLELEVRTPETPAWHQGDPTRLAQVVDNLLDNAARYTERGGQVSARLTVDPGRRQAEIRVTDTGDGISPDVLPQLFQPFVQAVQSLERPRGGLGLGLAVVKGLVELHGGTIEAAGGEGGRGTTFIVRLPLEPEPAAVSQTSGRPVTGERALRVLVVEDNRDAADSLKMLLELAGHEARVAHTGPEGVQAAKGWCPDVVVCDIGLPGLDGYGVARELRHYPATAGVRLVALTGYGGEEERQRSRQAGFDHHMSKPADPQALLGLIAAAG